MFYRCIKAIFHAIAFVCYRVHIVGSDNVPEGAVVLCANHTATHDPGFPIIAINGRHHLYFMIKAELMKVPVLSLILKGMGAFGINREMSDVSAIKHAIKLLKEDKKLFIFPEGTRVREGQSVEAKTGAVMLAYRCQAPILPVYITSGRKRPFTRVDVVIGTPYLLTCAEKRPPADFYETETKKLMETINHLNPQRETV